MTLAADDLRVLADFANRSAATGRVDMNDFNLALAETIAELYELVAPALRRSEIRRVLYAELKDCCPDQVESIPMDRLVTAVVMLGQS